MSSKVVYYTQSGNTEKIANAIAAELSCEATTIDTPLSEAVDNLFIGASVYKFGVDKNVIAYVEKLDSTKVGQAIIFSTSSMSDSVYPKLSKLLTAKGIKVCEKRFHCKGEFMIMNKNRPNAEDLTDAKNFAQQFK